MGAGQAFLLLDTAATLVMAGVIWTMQVLNYPLLALVGAGAFPRYEAAHNRRFALVVAPGVLAALAGAAGLLAGRPAAVSAWAPPSELALLAVVLISTAAWQARQHGRLAEGFDPVTHRLLVQTNWLRVAAWSAAGIIALWMCHQAFRP